MTGRAVCKRSTCRKRTQALPLFTHITPTTHQSVTDARAASAVYEHNSRHLITSINYSAPSGIPATPNVSFGYDAAGNRTSMTDGTGSTSYAYDQLSRMSSETHTITGLGAKLISYQYNLANQLTSITDPLNVTINYGHDQAGRLSGVTGSGDSAVPTFASNMQYRAWGAVKHLDYGNGRTLDATYNSRLQSTSFQIPGVISKTYEYYADNRLRFSSDLIDHRFDRFYSYDHASRIKEAFSGAEARFEPATDDRPYRQTYGFDAMGHLTQRTSKVWLVNMSSSDSYTNNRHNPVGSLWQYDADGNPLMMPGTGYEYDAAGRAVTLTTATPTNLAYDGDGRQVKSAETVYDPETETETTTTKYYVRSTVLGGEVLTEIEPENNHTRTFVYAGGSVLATQESYGSPFVWWEHRDPSNATYRTTMVGTQPGDHAELDPSGTNAGISNGVSQSIPDEGSLAPYPSFGNPSQLGTTYSWDGIRMPADEFFQVVNQLMHGRFGIAQALMRGTRVTGTRTTTHTRIIWSAVQDGNMFFPSGPPVFFMQASFTEPLYGPDALAMDLLFAGPQEPAKPSHDRHSKIGAPQEPAKGTQGGQEIGVRPAILRFS
jgi:YD repeat-containing protein